LEALDLSENTKLSPMLGTLLAAIAKHPTVQDLDIHGIHLGQLQALGSCLAENRSLRHISISLLPISNLPQQVSFAIGPLI